MDWNARLKAPSAEKRLFLDAWCAAGYQKSDLIHGYNVPMQAAYEVKAIDKSKRTVTAVISSGKTDRVGDIIDQAGWDFKNFNKNPVVLFGHDSRTRAPIGKNLDLSIKGDRLIAITEFAETPFAEEIFSLFVGGFMKAFSVGFDPKKWELIEDKKGNITGFHFLKQELLEYSAVPIPAHQDAVAAALSEGLISDSVAALFGPPTSKEPEPVIQPPTLASKDAMDSLRLANAKISTYLATR